MAMYKGVIPVIYRDLNEGWIRGTPDVLPGTGAVPRDFSIDPVEMRDSPDQMPLVKESEWDALYDKGEEAEDSLEHIVIRASLAGQFEFLDQGSFPDCWAHSTGNALAVDRLKQNLPFVKFNAVAVATMMNRTNGGWCGASMKFAREKGYPLVGPLAPFQSRRVQNTAELQAQMQQHRSLEDWYDMARQEWDQDLTKQQIATCLFNNLPTPSDYNRFGHSMLSLRLVRIEAGHWGLLTLNSWKQFGYHGLCVLANMWPDGSCALRSSTPSVS